jgi:hypothetical protein
MKNLKLIVIIFFAMKINFIRAQSTQTIVPPCSAIVGTAQDLKCILDYFITKPLTDPCNSPFTVLFKPDVYIDLGTLPPEDFPLIVPEGIILQGDYNLNNIGTDNKSHGTTIYFPYLYLRGYNCRQTGNPATDSIVSALWIKAGSAIKNINLIGGRNDDTGIRWEPFPNMCLTNAGGANPPTEGVASGIICFGNNITISDCEISGFQVFGAEIKDMVLNAPNPVDHCYSFPNEGVFTFERNYVHNCKVRGFGYGLWVSGGSGQDSCISQPSAYRSCEATVNPGNVVGITRRFKNFDAPNENANITGCYFYENGHDIDATYNRNSMNINSCTFSERAMDMNINRHTNDVLVCNQNKLLASNSFCQTGTNSLYASPCLDTIYSTGGHQTRIRFSVFHKPVNNIVLPYPNMNECQASGVNGAFVQIENDYFNTLFSNSGQDFKSRIEIGNYFLENWNFKLNYPSIGYPDDPNLRIGEAIGTGNSYDQFYQNITPQLAPIAVIASNIAGSGLPSDISAKDIFEGDKINFESILSSDGNGILLTSTAMTHCVLLYRFHTMKDDSQDEVRVLPGTVVTHKFDKAGIVDVNLMIIDLNTNYESNLATQQITVKLPPASTGARNREMSLIFNIKDSHTDRNLSQQCATCPCASGYEDMRADEVVLPPTGFEKYAMVDGIIVWSQDIAGDSGWQHIEVDLKKFFTPPFYGNHTLEIGIRAVAPVDADRVRGVELYIDDIFIDNIDGENCIYNGDLEIPKNTPSVTLPNPVDFWGWDTYNEGDFDNNLHLPPQHLPSVPAQNVITFPLTNYPGPSCTSPYQLPTCSVGSISEMYLNVSTAIKSTRDVRSGHYSFEGWVRPLTTMSTNCNPGGSPVLYYYTGLQYSEGYYKALVFDGFHRNYVHRNMSSTLDFELWPNPSEAGNSTVVVIKENENSMYEITITDIRGKTVFEKETKSKSYKINNRFMPGVYYVTVTDNEKRGVKKMVVLQ